MHKNHMKTVLRVLSCSDMRDKGFLLKIYLENHKPRVDGNTSACASTHQHTYHYYDVICQNSSQGNRERKHVMTMKKANRVTRQKEVAVADTRYRVTGDARRNKKNGDNEDRDNIHKSCDHSTGAPISWGGFVRM